VLQGLGGNDNLNGGSGNDVYLLGRGAGQDLVTDYDEEAGNVDTVRFDASVSTADIKVTRDYSSLHLEIGGTADHIILNNWFNGDANKVEQFEFADGTVWDVAMLESLVLTAPATEEADLLFGNSNANTLIAFGGNDELYGEGGDDTLDGGVGNDYLIGGAGSDVYLFGAGSGQDWIEDADLTGGDTDVVRFDATVSVGDVKVARDYSDLYLKVEGTDDQIVLSGWFGNDASRVDRVEFADGTVWDIAMLESLVTVLPGTGADDTLFGSSGDNTFNALQGNDVIYAEEGDDTLDGGAGNDELYGGAGNDVYLFGAGFGTDWVEDFDQAGGSIDTVRFDSTISLEDVKVTRDESNLYLNIEGTTDQVVLANWFWIDAYRIEQVEFADGTVWDSETLSAMTTFSGTPGEDALSGGQGKDMLQGLDGDDSLFGGEGADVLEGGAGNDGLWDAAGDSNYFNGGSGDDQLLGRTGANLLLGGTGNDAITSDSGPDVIAFNVGDGQDTLYVNDSVQNLEDTISLGGAGLDYANLSLQKNGDDLVLKLSGTDQLTLADWYAGTPKQSVLNLQLVAEAMSAFDANSSDPLLNKKVQTFDFQGLVGAFDTARTATPGLSSWALSNGLTQFHLAGSDSEALGGDLAYHYGADGTLAGMGLGKAQEVLTNAQFGAQAQAVHSTASLQEGLIRLG